mgnify:CR=1 FL=1
MKNDEVENDIKAESLKHKKPISPKVWYVELFVISLSLCFIFAIISQLMLLHANLALALILILILIGVSVYFDIVGVAVAASHIKPFLELKSKGYKKGVDKAIFLVKNADRVSSICTDVVGDICSILSGAGGVAISIIIIKEFPGWNNALLSTLISSLIAALTVFGKALGKSYALNYSTKILLSVGKMLNLFSLKKKKNK